MYLLSLIATLCVKTSTCSTCIKSSLLSSSFFPLSSVRSGGGKIRFYGEEQFSSKWHEFRLDFLGFLCKEIPLTFSTVPTGTESQMSLWGTFSQHGPDPSRLERYLTIKPDTANIMPQNCFSWRVIWPYSLVWACLICPVNTYRSVMIITASSPVEALSIHSWIPTDGQVLSFLMNMTKHKHGI